MMIAADLRVHPVYFRTLKKKNGCEGDLLVNSSQLINATDVSIHHITISVSLTHNSFNTEVAGEVARKHGNHLYNLYPSVELPTAGTIFWQFP